MFSRILALLLLLAPAAHALPPCDPCTIAGGAYRAVTPPGWNGADRLPVLLFLHGWRANGSDMVTDPSISGPTAALHFLLIAPDGAGGTWSFIGAPGGNRDDFSFLHAVLADVHARWPVEDRTVVAGGYSIGGSMVWDLACHAAGGFTAFLPFSGGFWEPMPEACTSGPVNLRHVHGRADTTVPLAGRSIGGRWRQADILQGFAIWRAEDRCAVTADRHTRSGELDCDIWSACGSGRTLQLCLHPGDHVIDAAWLEGGLRWALALSAAPPAR